MNRLAGGQKSEFQQGFNLPFFHPNVKTLILDSKNVYGVRILPAFDLDDSRNPKGPLTYVPYRDINELDPETHKPMFTSWYYPLKGYKFVGNAQRALLSPLTFELTDCRGRDPLFDCYLTAKNMPEEHPWHVLVEKPDDISEGYNAVLTRPKVFNAMNLVTETEKNKFDVRLAVVTKASMDHLKDQLNMLTPMGDTPIDPNWPTYVLGDITSPDYGLWGFVRSGSFNRDNKKMTTMLFEFSQQADRAVNVLPWKIHMDQQWGQDILAKRYHIGDLETVTKIMSAEEILDFIVTDGFLPIELVEAACGNTWAIPRGKSTGYKPKMSWDQAVDKAEGKPPAVTAPPGGRLSQAAATPAQDRQFWILLPGNQVSQQTVPESTVLNTVMINKFDHMVCLSGTTEWKPASSFGIVAPAPAAPVAPPVPIAPAAPSVPTAPAAPTAPPPPAAAFAPTSASGPMPTTSGPPPAPRPAVSMPPTSRPLTPGAPPPTAMGGRPMPVQAPAGQPPAPPVQAPVQQAPVSNAALSEEELAELKVLQVEWNEVSLSGKPIATEKIQRYLYLNDRLGASRSALKPTETT